MPLLPSHTLLQTYTLTLIGSSYLLLSNPLSLLNAAPLWLLGESMHMPRASFVPATPNMGNDPAVSAPGATLYRKKSLPESLLGNNALLSNDIREVLALMSLCLFLAAITQGVLATPLRYSKEALLALAQKSRASKHGNYNDEHASSEFAEKLHTLHTAQTLFLTLAGLRVMVEGALIAAIYLLYSEQMGGRDGAKIRSAVDGVAAERGLLALLANRIVFAVVMGDMLFWGYIYTVLREEARDIAEVLARRRQMEEEDRE